MKRIKKINWSLWRRRVALPVAMVVVFVTTYSLILPAITMERESFCGLEEHTHSDECYTVETVYTCGLEEGEEHTHTEECISETRTLTCGLEEHVHTEECYVDPNAPAEEETDAADDADAAAPAVEDAAASGDAADAEAGEDIPAADAGEDVPAADAGEDVPAADAESDGDAASEDAASDETGAPEAGSSFFEVKVEGEPEAAAPVPADVTFEQELDPEHPDRKVTVVVDCTAAAGIPADAVLEVKEFFDTDEEYDGFFAAVEGELCKNGEEIFHARFFDFTIRDAAGNELALQAPVKVKVVSDALTDQLVHAVSLDAEQPAEVELTAKDNTVRFDADGFTSFAIVVLKDEELPAEEEPAAVPVPDFEMSETEFMEEGEVFFMPEAEPEEEPEPLVGADVTLKKVLVSDGQNVTITVDCKAEAGVPADAQLQVREIKQTEEAYDGYLNDAKDAIDLEKKQITFVRFFDITILDANGNEIQPTAAVDVKIVMSDAAQADEENAPQVLHYGEENTELVDSVTEGDTVSFEANGFSVYGIVGTEPITVPFVAGDGRTYEVTVNFGNNAGIPENAKLQVFEVLKTDEDYDSYVERSAEAIDSDADSLNYIKLLDISIVDEGGNKVVLLAPVDVQIRLMDDYATNENTQVVHFAEDAEPEVIAPEVGTDTVSFETGGFSIYAIIEDDVEVVPRRTYHFVRLNEETGALEPYLFYNQAHELVDNQIIKNGDDLEPINTPYIPDEETWGGWRVVNIEGYDPDNTSSQNYTSLSYGRDVVFDEPLTVTQTEDIYVIPFFGHYHTATFIDYLFNEDVVTGYLIHNREEVPLGTSYDTTVQTVPSHKSVGGSSQADLVFVGWRLLHDESQMAGYFTWDAENNELKLKDGVSWSDVDPQDEPDGHDVPGIIRDANKYVIGIEMDPDESRNYVLLPVYKKAYWVEYYSGPVGSGATYVAPVHVGVGETAAAAGAEPTVTMNWRGYEFQYWTETNTFDADGKPIEYNQDNQPPRYNFNQVLTKDVKLYAYWKKATTTYTVMFWRQQLGDDKNLTADQKTYDYAGQRTGTGTVDAEIHLTDADQHMNDATYNSANEDYKKYTGFTYAKTDAEGKTINANGSTVVNVYYDRNLITMNFDRDIDSYTPTEDETGTVYGLVDGQYIQLTWNGTNWEYTTDEPTYADYTGQRYNSTTGDNGTQYGVYQGSVVRVYHHYQGGWFGYNHWSRRSEHATSMWTDDQQYDGPRYVQNNNGEYGFVDGAMVPLTNGQYQNGTQPVTHVYDGPKYKKTTTRSFTGLYGQLLEKYGYKWPADTVWSYDTSSSQTPSKGMSYLGEFVLPTDVQDTTGKTINLHAQGSPTNYIEFYTQLPNSTQPGNVSSYQLNATGSYDFNPYINVDFVLSDKYEGFTVYGYRRFTGTGSNKRYADANIVPAAVNDTVRLKGDGPQYNLDVYYKVYSYDVTYKDPVTREVLSNDAFNYGANIDNNGAPAASVVEGHVPVGYRLLRDDEGHIIWYADPNRESVFNFDRTMPNHDLEVFPGFEPIYYWIKIEPNGGVLSGTESTWFWKRHGDTSVYEYTDASRGFTVDPDGEYYYHYDEFVDPVNDVNQYNNNTNRKAEYRKIADYDGEGTWLDDSYDGKRYTVTDRYALDGWYEVVKDASGNESLIPYHFGSPITHNTTLRAIWITNGAYSTVYKVEGVDADGNPLYTYTVGDKTYLVTHFEGEHYYSYFDEDGDEQVLDPAIGRTLPKLTGTGAPVGGHTYEDQSDTIILHRPDPPEGYVCTGYYYFDGTDGRVYIPGNVFKIDADEDYDHDRQFVFYPIYEPISDRKVEVTNITFDPNVTDADLGDVVLDSTLKDEFEGEGDNLVQKQGIDAAKKTVMFMNRQINSDLTLLGEIYTRRGYELLGWSLTPGKNNTVDFELGQEHVAADNLSKEGNTDANTLYAVWRVKKYTITVEKIVESDWAFDKSHRFTFVPDFTGMEGLTTELQTNFSLTGDIDSDTHIKTFETQVPFGTLFSITEAVDEKWTVEVRAYTSDEDGNPITETGLRNGNPLFVNGNIRLVFRNQMETAATVTFIKTNENGTSDITSDGIRANQFDDIVLSGARFSLLRKATADGAYTLFMQDLVIDKFGTISLPQGFYKLVENQPPAGYIMTNNTWEFVVDYDGSVYATLGQPGLFFRPTNDTSDSRNRVSDESFVITNQPGSALPMTGASGTLPYTLGGAVLIIASALMYGFRMRRRERRLR